MTNFLQNHENTKKLLKAGLLTLGGLSIAACSTTAQAPETPAHIITIDGVDSEGNTLLPGEAAIEDVYNEASRQAEALGIRDAKDLALLEAESKDATQEAIANDNTGRSENLVGDRVGVTVTRDGDGFPLVAVIQQK